MKSILSRVKFNKKQMTVMIALSVLACVTNIISTNIAAKLTTRFAADLRKEVFYKVQAIIFLQTIIPDSSSS